jgi:quercetin dioxygenase-like cupin family protein
MNRVRFTVLACTLSFLGGAGLMWAQQQAQVTRREPQFENAHVKVWKSIIEPKQPLSPHRHEFGRTLIAITDTKLDVIDDKGKVTGTYDWKAGKAYWLDADPPGQMHADRNNSNKAMEVIVVEMKK